MSERRDPFVFSTGVVASAAMALCYQLGRVHADGIPSAPTMFYGVSLEENGAPVSGTRDLRVRFFDGEMGGTQLCETLANSTTVTQGRARIALSETCRTAVQQDANVWVELAVGGNVVGARSRIGAVPYAVEAQRANDLTPAAQQRLTAEPDCPRGYTRDNGATGIVLCRKPLAGATFDEIVRVGSGPSSFWIDRYEASIWRTSDGSGNSIDTSTGLPIPPTGEIPSGAEIYALSVVGVPAATLVTYYQATVACRLSGKVLPTSAEWQWAAVGTPISGDTDGSGGTCVHRRTAGPMVTGGRLSCASRWGSQDHLGNVFEMSSDWAVSPVGLGVNTTSLWPPGFPQIEGVWASQASAGLNGADGNRRIPSVNAWGGFWGGGGNGGRFALATGWSVAERNSALGFRCAIPRP